MIFLCLICVTWLFVVDALHVGSILGKKWLAVSTSAVMASWLQLHAPILLIDNVQIYDSVASTYDSLDNGYLPEALGLNKLRDKAGSLVQGAVLEVGVGTGIQLSHYKWDQIESFTGLDASNGMLSEASNKVINIQESYPKVNLQFVQSNAEDMAMLPTQQQFDTIVDTFSMCVYDHPEEVLKAMKSHLKDDGRLILLENSRSTIAPLALLQDVLEPVITPMSKNCKWNVNVPQLTKDAGLIQDTYEGSQYGTIMLGTYKKSL